jgi:hypothetical protein
LAEQSLTSALGDALITFLDWAWPRVAPKFEEFFESVADAVRPDPPMTLHTVDGDVVTGVAVIDGGRVVAFVGSRQPAQQAQHWRTHRGDHSPYDDDSPLWGRDVRVEPYRRHP